MGGSGSGNFYHYWRASKKTVVEDCLRIDAARWMREAILKANDFTFGSWDWQYRSGQRFSANYQVDTRDPTSAYVRLYYSWVWTRTQQQESTDYRVRLVMTRPRFGGLRWWFVCPLTANGRACARRVGKLYLPSKARYFGCRHCHELTYTSCQESHKYDSAYRLLAQDTGYDLATVKRAMQSIGKRE